MQRIAARVALDERRPTRSLLDIAAHIEEDAAAPVATSRGSRVQAYDGALPQLESGAIHPRIDPEPAGASVALALATPLAFTVAMLHSPDGKVSAIASIIRDETSRFNEERALKKRLAELEARLGPPKP